MRTRKASKFAFRLGRGQVDVVFYLTEPYLETSKSLNLYIFCDESGRGGSNCTHVWDCVKLARQTRAVELKDRAGL